MNRLKTNINGGFPLALDDIRYNDDAYRHAFANLLKVFAFPVSDNPNFVVNGCERQNETSTYCEVTDGYVWIQDELIRVDAHSLTLSTPGDSWGLKKQTTFDSAGNKVFFNGTSHQTYEKNRAVLVEVDPQNVPADVVHLGAQTYRLNRIEERINLLLKRDWIYPSLNPGYTNDANNKLRYRVNHLGHLEIAGRFAWDGTGGSVVFKLPPNYRPSHAKYNCIYVGDSVDIFYIETNGDVYTPGGGSWSTVNYNEINQTIFRD